MNMRSKIIKTAFSTCFILAGMLVCNPASVANQNSTLTLFHQPKVNNRDVNSLPHAQIKRFTKAIAIIKKYYIKNVDDTQLFNKAIRGMVSNLDPHSSFLDANDLKDLKTAVSGEFVGIGVELTTQRGALKVISPLEGTPAFRAGIKANDLIIKIDGKLVQNMTLQEAINRIKGKRGTDVLLTIIRKGIDKPLDITVTRDVIKLVSIKSKMLENDYGYVRITFFQGPVDRLLDKAVHRLLKEANGRLKGLVLDLRNNPGGLLDESAKVADTFLDSHKLHKYNNLIVYTQGRLPGSDIKFRIHPGDLLEGIPLVVLINGGSASASEIVAGALQDYKRAVVMGTPSFGKGSVQTVFPIDKENAIKLTTALYHTPSGRVIQARGIQPDVMIPELTISDKKITGLLDIDESDFQNHLSAEDNKNEQARLEILKQQRAAELKLAKEDYQLYEALMMLKGMNAVIATIKK